ncbi:putative membrane protein [Dyadobacter sp. BE34]|uniref:Membrane protein n=1 Tax=Dyadobacter fermentans TaxID=94254 RepID=A0ABU1R5V4_9BACT|nr:MULTISPECIES: c-type cytochrome domain-containing protein [Dyadobacter]MDR6808789.1 putative membrane protein [Dyadobacter fermentans]MDR7046532.1 putative membrane protein [Dyadobacter sp. BE242]MDR7200845.1 putative membrane protein [Dyadobacter sp. BE34]MDR7218805.1 putative membrane protein [Dyadobacter sp. BE31]MDR7266735.1 putative membrane protein [Dyadobacter sp. BE32]
MHLKLRVFAEQLLVASNIFILFLLLFESKLVIPVWLQTIGRMHPLILHFPIVILLLAMLLEFFRFKPEYAGNAFYRNFLQGLLLIGALFAAVTVIMGLFLSREEGYEGATLTYHKWTGVGIFFFASIIYWVRNARWYKSLAARAGALLSVVALVLTGHYGAALTHGSNFIWEPISSKKEVAEVTLDQAVVYTNVIKPILEQKCTSCHNPDKLKGELILTDPQSITKGGKSGKLLVPGNPQMSLLLQRVHLPMEEKKHMPPSGKAQLTLQEISLLTLWVKQKADFQKKLTALPASDSLRMLATAFLQPHSQEEEYDFPAVDEDKVKALNTDYRTILPLARESPALAVNIYNAAAYNVSQLDELGDIRKQVISLNLNKMPVKDADLKSIAKFENLRKLDLNFTDVSAAGLKELSGLKHLQNLTLSGTKLGLNDLKGLLPQLKSVKTVAVWDTKLSAADVQQLQQANKGINIIGGFKDDGKNPLKLNPPQMTNASPIFAHTLVVDIQHPIKGVDVRFTMDGSEPDSVKSPLMDHKTVINSNTTIRAKAYKNGWYGSDMITFDYYKSAYQPDSGTLLAPLNRVHQAEGVKTFFDHKLGVIGANNPAWANNWAGVRDNDMAFVSEFKKPITLSSLGVRYMVEEDTGIFPPELVEIWGGTTRENMKLLTKFKAPMPVKGERASLRSVAGAFAPQQVSYIKIVAKPLSKIPAWHRNKDKRALLLVDEMFLN